jgi:hypothetical protein
MMRNCSAGDAAPSALERHPKDLLRLTRRDHGKAPLREPAFYDYQEN